MCACVFFVPVIWPAARQDVPGTNPNTAIVLGALAAAPLRLLGVSGSDGAGQGHGTDGATGHLSAGHLRLDGWRSWESVGKSKSSPGGEDIRDSDGATWEDLIESSFNIGRIQRWGLHEHETFRFWSKMAETERGAYYRHTVHNYTNIYIFIK